MSFRPRYNIAPGQHHWVVQGGKRGDDEVKVASACWGLPGHEGRLIDTVGCERLSRGGARRALRCVVPIDGFYKWLDEPQKRRPVWFNGPGGDLMWAAGICGLTAQGEDAFSLVTCQANALVMRASQRMPLLLTWRDVPDWLSRETPNDRLVAMMHPPAPHMLQAREVSDRINFLDRDDALCIESPTRATQLSLL